MTRLKRFGWGVCLPTMLAAGTAASVVLLGEGGTSSALASTVRHAASSTRPQTLMQLNESYPLSERAAVKATPRLAADSSISAMPDVLGQSGDAVVAEFGASSNVSAAQVTTQTITLAQDEASNAFIYAPGTVVAEIPAVGTPITSTTQIILRVTP